MRTWIVKTLEVFGFDTVGAVGGCEMAARPTPVAFVRADVTVGVVAARGARRHAVALLVKRKTSAGRLVGIAQSNVVAAFDSEGFALLSGRERTQ
ncbi:hypothetical protein AWENTII_002319 [Aspergillus wentii]